MKKSLIFAICFFVVLFSSTALVSSEVSLGKSVNSVYNFGDVIKLPITISFENDFSGLFILDLVCGEGNAEFYKEYLYLSSGDSASKTIYVPLINDLVGNLGGECSVVYSLGSEQEVLVENFKISDKINLNIEKDNSALVPGETLNIRGSALKENEKAVVGELRVFVEGGGSKDLEISKKINSEDFNLEMIIPEDFKAGQHLVSVEAIEFDSSGEKINYGKSEFFISITQVPNNLELIFEEESINPGATFLFKAVLHDQTGEKIDSSVYFALRNSNFEIIRKLEGKTGELMEYNVNDTELPGTWSVSAYSSELTQRKDFKIRKKKSIKIDLINDTLIITNNGNVPYNDTVRVEIGEEVLGIDVFLNYGSFVKYKLSAPKGVYEVSVEGVTESIPLTGRAVDVKKVSGSSGTGMGNILLWIFVIVILGFILLLIVKKGYKRAFFGRLKRFPLPVYRKGKKNYKEVSVDSAGKSSLTRPRLPSEISLSIKGSKQNAGLICLSIKNYPELSSGQGNTSETLSKIISLVESSKGFVFSNKGSLFFIFAPSKTKTFRNEMTLIHTSSEIKEILNEHNKKFKIKFNYGLSLNYGTIVTKEEEGKMKFMSMGTLMSDSRKLANLSRGEVLISEKVNERLSSEVKTEVKTFGSLKAYVIREIIDRGKHDTFIKGFLARQQRDRMKEGK